MKLRSACHNWTLIFAHFGMCGEMSLLCFQWWVLIFHGAKEEIIFFSPLQT